MIFRARVIGIYGYMADEADDSTTKSKSTIMLKQFGASLFFGVTSCIIVLVNKVVLTSYKYGQLRFSI